MASLSHTLFLLPLPPWACVDEVKNFARTFFNISISTVTTLRIQSQILRFSLSPSLLVTFYSVEFILTTSQLTFSVSPLCPESSLLSLLSEFHSLSLGEMCSAIFIVGEAMDVPVFLAILCRFYILLFQVACGREREREREKERKRERHLSSATRNGS